MGLAPRPKTAEWRHQHVVDLLLVHGRLFSTSPDAVPEWFGEQGACWSNATNYAEDYPADVVYVEGLAVVTSMAALGMDTPHAWCATGSTAIDPSPGWHDEPVVYLGVPFTHEFRRHVQRREGVFGLLWSVVGPDWLRNGLPDDAVAPGMGRPFPELAPETRHTLL